MAVRIVEVPTVAHAVFHRPQHLGTHTTQSLCQEHPFLVGVDFKSQVLRPIRLVPRRWTGVFENVKEGDETAVFHLKENVVVRLVALQ